MGIQPLRTRRGKKMNAEYITKFNYLYAAYRETYGRESVCNHDELLSVMQQTYNDLDTEDIPDEEEFSMRFEDHACELMLNRVGQPAPKDTQDYWELPLVN